MILHIMWLQHLIFQPHRSQFGSSNKWKPLGIGFKSTCAEQDVGSSLGVQNCSKQFKTCQKVGCTFGSSSALRLSLLNMLNDLEAGVSSAELEAFRHRSLSDQHPWSTWAWWSQGHPTANSTSELPRRMLEGPECTDSPESSKPIWRCVAKTWGIASHAYNTVPLHKQKFHGVTAQNDSPCFAWGGRPHRSFILVRNKGVQ